MGYEGHRPRCLVLPKAPEVSSAGEKLPEQAVCPLIEPPLSGAAGVAERACRTKMVVCLLVIEKFPALVIGNTFEKQAGTREKSCLIPAATTVLERSALYVAMRKPLLRSTAVMM